MCSWLGTDYYIYWGGGGGGLGYYVGRRVTIFEGRATIFSA